MNFPIELSFIGDCGSHEIQWQNIRYEDFKQMGNVEKSRGE